MRLSVTNRQRFWKLVVRGGPFFFFAERQSLGPLRSALDFSDLLCSVCASDPYQWRHLAAVDFPTGDEVVKSLLGFE